MWQKILYFCYTGNNVTFLPMLPKVSLQQCHPSHLCQTQQYITKLFVHKSPVKYNHGYGKFQHITIFWECHIDTLLIFKIWHWPISSSQHIWHSQNIVIKILILASQTIEVVLARRGFKFIHQPSITVRYKKWYEYL